MGGEDEFMRLGDGLVVLGCISWAGGTMCMRFSVWLAGCDFDAGASLESLGVWVIEGVACGSRQVSTP
jgi:hypothetical protein